MLVSRDNGTKPSDNPQRNALVGAYSVLAKSMIGSGMLMLASACVSSGWILGLTLALVAAIFSTLSLFFLAQISIEFHGQGQLSYLKLCQELLPQRFSRIMDVVVAVKCIGAAAAYLIFTGDIMSALMSVMVKADQLPASFDTYQRVNPTDINPHSARIVQGIAVAILGPFCFFKAITGTKIVNLLGLLCMAYITVVSVAKSHLSTKETSLYVTNWLDMLKDLPCFIFAFTCQQNIFGVLDDMTSPSLKKVNAVSVMSTLTGLILFSTVIVFPYGTYGKNTSKNFLKSYLYDERNMTGNTPDIWIAIACVAAAFAVIVSYPLQIIPCRRAIISLIYGSAGAPEESERSVRISITTGCILLTLGMALCMPSGLGDVVSLTGLIAGNLIAFVMPAILFLLAVRQNVIKASKLLVSMAWTVLVVSIVLYPLCLTPRFIKSTN